MYGTYPIASGGRARSLLADSDWRWMGSVSTLSQMLHLLLSPNDYRSIGSQARANFTKSRALTPSPSILHDGHLSERPLPGAHSTEESPLPPRHPPFTFEDTPSQDAFDPTATQSELDTVNFKDLVQSGKFTVKVTGLRSRDVNDLSSISCDLQVKANASQDDIWDAIENAGALEIC